MSKNLKNKYHEHYFNLQSVYVNSNGAIKPKQLKKFLKNNKIEKNGNLFLICIIFSFDSSNNYFQIYFSDLYFLNRIETAKLLFFYGMISLCTDVKCFAFVYRTNINRLFTI